jgi:hypothetical protein
MDSFLLSPLVIAHRLPQLMFEAFHPNPFAREESFRAVAEKVEAIGEGLIAAQVEAMNAPFRVGLAFLNGRSMALAALGAPRQVARAAVEPMERRVRANARRLAGVSLPPTRRRARK